MPLYRFEEKKHKSSNILYLQLGLGHGLRHKTDSALRNDIRAQARAILDITIVAKLIDATILIANALVPVRGKETQVFQHSLFAAGSRPRPSA
mmetsp:Transcript_58002/g.152499  ORF Transcript_58002/g.152499 Transcript_58002/m.152499 type:complete len:93 (+) Transcript_58002:123-401(+)